MNRPMTRTSGPRLQPLWALTPLLVLAFVLGTVRADAQLLSSLELDSVRTYRTLERALK